MSDDPQSRRNLLRGAGATLLLLPALPILAMGCKKELVCTSTAGLTPEEAAVRTSLEYVDATPIPTKNCLNCQLYKPAAPEACGGCSLIKGPIHPKGYCKSWTEKVG